MKKFYLKQGKSWTSYQSENKLVEQGRFRRWRVINCFFCVLIRPKLWSKVKRKIKHNDKDYLPQIKVGKWVYLDSKGKIVKTLIFNKYGDIE